VEVAIFVLFHLYISFVVLLRLCQYIDYIATNDKVLDKRRTGKNLEGSDHGPTHVLFLNIPRRSEENDEILL
jgi:hypothetical protein